MDSLALTYEQNYTVSCCDRLFIKDSSIYDTTDDTPILISIKPPTGCCFIEFPLTKGWCSKVFTCESFNECCVPDNNCCKSLNDGNYEIIYQVGTLKIENNHFRVCSLWKDYIQAVCNLLNKKCEISVKNFKEQKNKLWDIRNMILDSVILAEECLDVKAAKELYDEAKKLLNEKGKCKNC